MHVGCAKFPNRLGELADGVRRVSTHKKMKIYDLRFTVDDPKLSVSNEHIQGQDHSRSRGQGKVFRIRRRAVSACAVPSIKGGQPAGSRHKIASAVKTVSAKRPRLITLFFIFYSRHRVPDSSPSFVIDTSDL